MTHKQHPLTDEDAIRGVLQALARTRVENRKAMERLAEEESKND